MNKKYFTDCKTPAELSDRYQVISQVFGLNNMPEDSSLKKEVEVCEKQLMEEEGLDDYEEEEF